MNQVIDSLRRKYSDDSTGVNLSALEDRSLSAGTGSVENCRLDMVQHETWRSLPLLSRNLWRQTLQGEGSPPSQLEVCFFFSSRRRHTRLTCDWSSDVCSSD